MDNFKKYLIENGNSLLFWLNDVMGQNETNRVCTSLESSVILKKVLKDKSFQNLNEEECRILIKDFIEPVTYKDIDIVSIDPYYGDVHNSCGKLWLELPSKLKNIIYGNA